MAADNHSRLDLLRVRHFRLLELIDDLGSLTAAADRLGISQPSATKLLQEMERVLRCSLVDRSVRGGELTGHGRRALERARLAMRAIDQVPDVVTTTPERSIIRVGMLPVVGISLLPLAIERLEKNGALPRLLLQEGAVGELRQLLVEGRLDCVIGRLEHAESESSYAEFEITQLRDDPYELACSQSNPISRRRKLALRDLIDQPWILPARGSYGRYVFETAFLSQGIPAPTPVIESPSFQTTFAIAASNPRFLTVAPRSAIQHHAEARGIRAAGIVPPFPSDYMVFMARPDVLKMRSVSDLKLSLLEAAADLG